MRRRVDFLYKVLYNYCMLDIASLFSSRTRFRVLRTLVYQSQPLPLRHIAYLSGSPLFSVQRALKQLVEETILIQKREGCYSLFSLNTHHVSYPFLRQVFDLEMKNQIAFLSENYHKKAKSTLVFSSSARGLLKKARLWT